MPLGYPLTQGDKVAVTLKCDLFGQTILNRQVYYVTQAPLNVDAQVIFTAFYLQMMDTNASANWPVKIQEAVSSDVTLESLTFQPVAPTRRRGLTLGILQPGARQFPCLTANTAGVITKTSSYAARWGVGSMHIAGIPTDDQAEGELKALTLLSMANIGAALTQAFFDIGDTYNLEPVIWTPQTNDKPYRRVNGYIAQKQVRTMRRRTVGLGI